MLIAVLHITDLKFVDDQDVDGVYIGNDSSLTAGGWSTLLFVFHYLTVFIVHFPTSPFYTMIH